MPPCQNLDKADQSDATVLSSKEDNLSVKTAPSSISSETSSDSEKEDNSSSTNNAFPTGLKQRKNTEKNASIAAASSATENKKPVQPKNEYTTARWVEFMLGCSIFFGALPMVAFQIVCCTTWEFVDQSTVKLCDLATKVNELTGPYQKWMVSNPNDSFVVNTTIWLGGILPAYFVWEAITQTNSESGFIWWRAVLYNIIRIGPMYRHFMYVYVLCHKEAHCFGKIFAPPFHHALQYAYNYFIGFFHGVLPGPFTQSHIFNHHKYDNAQLDVYSTGAFPRDSFVNFLRYVYIWFLYALNVSTVIQFAKEGKYTRVWNTIVGTAYYAALVGAVYYFCGGLFVTAYVIYPLIEGNILLAMVNYTWHAFIDPDDFDNDYVNSCTFLEGLNFTLEEEYHVVHHQYAGIHWSRHREFYDKHLDEYKKCTATVFEKCNLFVIWGMIVAKDYDALTEHFVQMDDDKSKHLSKKELAQLLKERLQCTTWSY